MDNIIKIYEILMRENETRRASCRKPEDLWELAKKMAKDLKVEEK